MFMNSIKFYWILNLIYERFDCKKKMFLPVNLDFNWKKLNFNGQNIIFKSWFGQIRSLIA
jgi:hypothetical protein